MYIQAIYKENKGGSTTIGNLVEIDSWETAGMKLPRMYEGYDLYSMIEINVNIDKGDIYGPCFLVRTTSEGVSTVQYIFAADLNTAIAVAKRYGTVVGINQTNLTFKQEGPL